MAALFSAGSSSARGSGGADSSSASRNLIEFRAGKMQLKGTKVVPDKRKGLFYIHRERETMLTHVCWKDRTSGTVEDDLIVFPDDCKWSRVSQCTTGRVFLLRFTSSAKKLFFWMQEPKETKDEEYSEKINKILNDPEESQDAMPNMNSTSTEQLLSHMFGAAGGGPGGSSQEQMLQQLFQSGALGSRLSAAAAGAGATGSSSGGAAGAGSRVRSARASESEQAATAKANTSKAVSSSQQPSTMQLDQFQDLMSNLSSKGATSHVNLAAALPLDLSSMLASPHIIERLSAHVPATPEGPSGSKTAAATELRQSLAAPQFRQSLSLFSAAFSSGQLAPVISQFELGSEAEEAANSGDLAKFVEALNKKVKEKQSTSDSKPGGENEGKKDEDDKEKDNEKKTDENMETN